MLSFSQYDVIVFVRERVQVFYYNAVVRCVILVTIEYEYEYVVLL